MFSLFDFQLIQNKIVRWKFIIKWHCQVKFFKIIDLETQFYTHFARKQQVSFDFKTTTIQKKQTKITVNFPILTEISTHHMWKVLHVFFFTSLIH